MAYLPDDLYCHRLDDPQAGPHRPISQGDVFADIPLTGPAQRDAKQEDTWRAAKPRTGPKSFGMIVTHPCAGRSPSTNRLNPVLSVAPVVRCPSEWGPPWDGHLDLFPLPALRDASDYVAKLNEVGPMPSEAFEGHRIACLTSGGLTALYHRLARNSIRYPEIPAHFGTEAERLTNETDLWERWTEVRETEEGFQDWLSGDFEGQPEEDENGEPVAGTATASGQPRRAVLVWNIDELRRELEDELGTSRGEAEPPASPPDPT